MRPGVLLAAPLLLALVAGCLEGPAAAPDPCSGWNVGPTEYRYRFPGDDVAAQGHPYGWMARLSNPTNFTMHVTPVPLLLANVTWGPVNADGWVSVTSDGTTPDGLADLTATPPNVTLAGNASVLFLFSAEGFLMDHGGGGTMFMDAPENGERYGYRLDWSVNVTDDAGAPLCAAFGSQEDRWPVEGAADPTPVRPGDHVRTATVGLWTNGTSFYTNIAALNDDPAFPAGYARSGFGGDPLPVYVYDEDRREQPVGSADDCWFTTVPGYNALLRTQAEGSTDVRFLRPEEAYTRPGNEGFFLYGEPLVFLNKVVSHEGATGPQDEAPDPTGECFDPTHAQRKLPPLPAPRPPTAS